MNNLLIESNVDRLRALASGNVTDEERRAILAVLKGEETDRRQAIQAKIAAKARERAS